MIGELLAFGHSSTWFTYTLGVLLQTLPLPRKTLKAWGPTLMVDAVIAEFALATVGLAEVIVRWISNLIQVSIGSPLNPSASFLAIVTQLVTLDGLLLTIATLAASVAELLPLAEVVSKLLSPALTATTVALVLWIIVQFFASFLPSVWFSAYVLGVVFYSLPFRIGRKLGAYLMASSVILTIGIPLMPTLALSLQSLLGYKLIVDPLQQAVSNLQANPLELFSIIFTLSTILPRIIAAIVISLIIFPPVFFFVLSALIRGLSNVIGGASSGPLAESLILVPAYELGGAIAK